MKPRPRRKKSLDIGTAVVPIKYSRKDMYDDSGDLLHGAYDGKTIFVATSSDIDSTIFHEGLHSCLHVSGLSNLLGHALEEAVVEVIERAFAPYIDLSRKR